MQRLSSRVVSPIRQVEDDRKDATERIEGARRRKPSSNEPKSINDAPTRENEGKRRTCTEDRRWSGKGGYPGSIRPGR